MGEAVPSLPRTRAVPVDYRTSGDTSSLGMLTWYLVFLLAFPSRLVIGPLGGAGAPAIIMAGVSALLYVWVVVMRPTPPAPIRQPIRTAILIFGWTMLVSYGIAMSRPLSGDERSNSTLVVFDLLAWSGVALLASEGLLRPGALETLLRRLALLSGLFALFGLVQFATGSQLTDQLSVPGLTLNQALTSLSEREGFNRPSSTALHGIEFGVAVACLWPVALHVAMTDRRIGFLRRWWPVAALTFAVPISVSRSAFVGFGAALVVLVLGWTGRQRIVGLASLLTAGVAIVAAVPGLTGTVLGLFTNVSDDTSVQSRTDSYEIADYFFTQNPWLGRGIGTFLPKYRILDNQYLGLLIETGILGVLAILGVFLTAIVCLQVLRRRTADPVNRSLMQTLTASLLAATLGYGLFDALTFPLFAGFSFVLVGLAAATWRRERPGQEASVEGEATTA